MSIVFSFIHKQFALVCGDTNLTTKDGNRSNIEKVLMSSSNIIFGFTGDVSSNIDFFHPFIRENLTINETIINNYSFNQIVDILNEKYQDYIKKIDQISNFDICSMVVGFNGEKFCCVRYQISQKEIEFKKIESGNNIEIVGSGKEEHLSTFTKLYKQQHSDDLIGKLISIFQQTIDIGSSIDKSINNKMTYKLIYLED